MEKEDNAVEENKEEEKVAEGATEDDVPAVAGQELNMVLLKELMNKVNTQWAEGHTNITDFVTMYFEWTKLFRHFGNAVAVAFKGKYLSILSSLNHHSYRYHRQS